MLSQLILFIFALTICLLFTSCGLVWLATALDFDPKQAPPAPHYDDLYYWAAHPNKQDYADTMPPNSDKEKRTNAADIFYIYPTLHGTPFPVKNDHWNANLADKSLNNWIDRVCVGGQASAFSAAGRVFAPRYREVHSFVYEAINKKSKEAAFDLAYQDVKAAFVYYLEHENNGRPIIIATHSQGTNHGLRLLKEFFDEKPLYKQLVAAYLIGMPVPKGYFKQLKPSQSPTETGVFCTWRTFRKGFKPEKSWVKIPDILYSPDSHVTNPLTWRSDVVEYAPASLNLGGYLLRKQYKNCADAQIYNGFLWANLHVVGMPLWTGTQTSSFHLMDYQFYYYNIRANAVERVEAFLKKGN